jgi:hypothetical protein
LEKAGVVGWLVDFGEKVIFLSIAPWRLCAFAWDTQIPEYSWRFKTRKEKTSPPQLYCSADA